MSKKLTKKFLNCGKGAIWNGFVEYLSFGKLGGTTVGKNMKYFSFIAKIYF